MASDDEDFLNFAFEPARTPPGISTFMIPEDKTIVIIGTATDNETGESVAAVKITDKNDEPISLTTLVPTMDGSQFIRKTTAVTVRFTDSSPRKVLAELSEVIRLKFASHFYDVMFNKHGKVVQDNVLSDIYFGKLTETSLGKGQSSEAVPNFSYYSIRRQLAAATQANETELRSASAKGNGFALAAAKRKRKAFQTLGEQLEDAKDKPNTLLVIASNLEEIINPKRGEGYSP